MIQFEHRLNKVENGLSLIAAVPGVGTVAGLAKVLLGLAQTISAIAARVFLSIDCRLRPNTSSGFKFMHAGVHINHGLGNMFAGILEAIPLLGTGLFMIRKSRWEFNHPHFLYNKDGSKILVFHSTQHDKFMPYPTLVGYGQSGGMLASISEEKKEQVIEQMKRTTYKIQACCLAFALPTANHFREND